ncbi:COX20 [Candida oxycetoniae]|uniref:Cytochrome c oxidase assembly protein COX20, mitochondrial n=1 Tax=Candida oxycetoniae TaxID=497107 RepID=A0AAI9T0M9_9ASCO|nr:COX20 [Candida oxycetoniae]KAI3406447.2 COX20 [Candida oxycetoniae]
MGWFSGSSTSAPPSKVSIVSEYNEEASKPKQQYLEDLPPKFEDSESSGGSSRPPPSRQPTLTDAAKLIKLSDFNIDRFVSMPCFREAMITGFQAMGVLGIVTFLVHKNVGKSLNWSVGGFFLGNLVGWEQCRSLRRRSFEVMEKAKREKEERNRKKLAELSASHSKDENFAKFQEFNNRK